MAVAAGFPGGGEWLTETITVSDSFLFIWFYINFNKAVKLNRLIMLGLSKHCKNLSLESLLTKCIQVNMSSSNVSVK